MEKIGDCLKGMLDVDLLKIEKELESSLNDNLDRSDLLLEETNALLSKMKNKKLHPAAPAFVDNELQKYQQLFVAVKLHYTISHAHLLRLEYSESEPHIKLAKGFGKKLIDFNANFSDHIRLSKLKLVICVNTDYCLLLKRLSRSKEVVKNAQKCFVFLKKNENEILGLWDDLNTEDSIDQEYQEPEEFICEHLARLYHYYAFGKGLEFFCKKGQDEFRTMKTELFYYIQSFAEFSKLSKMNIFTYYFMVDYAKLLANFFSQDEKAQKAVISYFEKLLVIFEEDLEEINVQKDKLFLLRDIGELEREQFRFDECYEIIKSRFKILRNIEIARVYINNGISYLYRGKIVNAKKCWKHACRYFMKQEGVDPYYDVIVKKLVQMLEARDNYLTFDKHYRVLKKSKKEVIGILSNKEILSLGELLYFQSSESTEEKNNNENSAKINLEDAKKLRKLLETTMLSCSGISEFLSNVQKKRRCESCSTNLKRLFVCSACRKVCYCCREHQGADWKNHKDDCRKWKKKKKK